MQQLHRQVDQQAGGLGSWTSFDSRTRLRFNGWSRRPSSSPTAAAAPPPPSPLAAPAEGPHSWAAVDGCTRGLWNRPSLPSPAATPSCSIRLTRRPQNMAARLSVSFSAWDMLASGSSCCRAPSRAEAGPRKDRTGLVGEGGGGAAAGPEVPPSSGVMPSARRLRLRREEDDAGGILDQCQCGQARFVSHQAPRRNAS